MHEPIIDIDMWDNAQKKLNKYTRVRTRKYDHPLKGLVYCKECGSIATIRAREGTKKMEQSGEECILFVQKEIITQTFAIVNKYLQM